MGGSSSKKKAPPPSTATRRPPQQRQRYEPTPEELARKRREEEETKRWIEEAKRVGPPCPPKPTFSPGGTENEYKRYMLAKYDYEAWENNLILLSRRLRTQAQQQGQRP